MVQSEGSSVFRQPLVVIEPHTSWLGINLRELIAYHELLYFLTWRDVKVRYKQTVLGIAWALLQPLCMMAIFALFFGRLVGVPSDGVPYPLFAFAGLLPWTFFSTSITSGGNSVVNSANLITKVYFPRLIVPTAAVAASLVDLGISFLPLIALMAYYSIPISSRLFMLPVLFLLLIAIGLGIAILMAALNVKYRDIRFVLPFVIQLWFFASPIIYPSSVLPPRWQWLYSLNPMTGIIEGFRASLFGVREFNWPAIAFSAVFAIVLLVCATATFKRMEKSFADII